MIFLILKMLKFKIQRNQIETINSLKTYEFMNLNIHNVPNSQTISFHI